MDQSNTYGAAYPYRMTNKVRDETTKKKDKLIGYKCPSFKSKYLRTRGKKQVKTGNFW